MPPVLSPPSGKELITLIQHPKPAIRDAAFRSAEHGDAYVNKYPEGSPEFVAFKTGYQDAMKAMGE